MFRRIWKAVEAKAREVRMVETERRREKRRSRKKQEEKEEKKKKKPQKERKIEVRKVAEEWEI